MLSSLRIPRFPLKALKHTLPVLLLLAALCLPAAAQRVYYKRFSTESELPSSVLYRVYSDSRKFIWVSSDAGLARFDGRSFQNFSAKDGVPDNEVFDLTEDSLGRIWFTTLRGIIGNVHHARVSTGLKNPALKNEFIRTVFFDHAGDMWLSTGRGDILRLKGDSVTGRWKRNGEKGICILEDRHGRIWITGNQAHYLSYIEGDKIKDLRLADTSEPYAYTLRPVLMKDGNILFYGYHSWGIVNTQTLKVSTVASGEELADRILMSAMEDPRGNIWIGTSRGVLLYEADSGSYLLRKRFLESERITMMTRDFEGNYWLSTLSSGLYYVPCNPLAINNYQIRGYSDNVSVILRGKNGRIWLGNDEGNIFDIAGGDVRLTYPNAENLGLGRIVCGTVLRDGSVCFGKNNALMVIRPDGSVDTWEYSAIKSLQEADDGNIWVGTHAELVLLDGASLKPKQHYQIGRVTAIYADGPVVWFANEYGLNVLENGVPRLFLDASVFQGQRISSVKKANGLIWVATLGNGIYSVDPKRGPRLHITSRNGLSSDICNSLNIDDQGHIWVATKRGVNQVRISAEGNYRVLLINHENGLIADEANDLKIDGDTIWVATAMGITQFEVSSINYLPVPPPVYIESFSNSSEEFPLQRDYDLPFNRSQFKIRLVGISFTSGENLRYKHKLEGLDSNWIENTSPLINYPFLEPGNYHFIAKAINSRGKESDVAAELFITIRPAYWQTIWFKVFIGFIIFLIILSSIVVRIKVIKKREEEKTRLNKMLGELELTALKAQMNPHFIFNSLGSIQNLINRDKKIEANVYLSKFAKLLRMTLDHSDKREVSLADEINMLELYLGLEALRFVNKFEYRIEADPGIDAYAVKIPPMILQPFIENAIKHGLLPKKADALLLVKFSMLDDESLYCMVEDNGIGRVQREKLKEKSTSGHVSKGIKITKNRLELVNQLRSRPAEIRITDLYKDSGEAAGTRIEIYIPID